MAQGVDVLEDNEVTATEARSASEEMEQVVADVWSGLEKIADPCIFQSGRDLSIVDLGLINQVWRDGDEVNVSVTLTDTMCINAPIIFVQIERIAEGLEGISEVNVVPKSYPAWTEDRLSEKARNLFAADLDRYWPGNKQGALAK